MKKYVIILVALLCSIYAVYTLVGTTTPPYEIEIDLSKKGNVYETTVKIKEKTTYYLLLGFVVKPSDNSTELYQTYDFLGETGYKIDTKEEVSNGTIIPIKLTIYKTNNKELKELIVDNIYQTKGYYAYSSSGIERRMASLVLDEGIYSIRLETLEDFSFLDGRDTYFRITRPYGK
jgi:hypothetical protein